MFCFQRTQNAGRNAEYATRADFCRIFEKDMKPLYLLAFLLTGNHASAERCFVASLEDIKGNAVFKEWARSWSKWIVIKQAIQTVFSTTDPTKETRECWNSALHNSKASAAVDAVTRLATLERFVFVLSVLEEYSDRKCCVLLSCTLQTLVQARIQALRKVPALYPEFTVVAHQHLHPLVAALQTPGTDFISRQEVRDGLVVF